MTSGRRISSQGARANYDFPAAARYVNDDAPLGAQHAGGCSFVSVPALRLLGGWVHVLCACVSRAWETTVTRFCMRRIKSLRGGET